MKTIVVVSDIPWTALYQRPQALSTAFAKHFDEVVYVEPWHPSGQKIVPLPRGVKRIRLWYWPFNARIPMLGRKMGALSVPFHFLTDAFNRFRLYREIGPAPDVIFIESPQQGNLVKGWTSTTIVFDYIDRFQGFVAHPQWVTDAFYDALSRADLRIATHPVLADEAMAHGTVGQGSELTFKDRNKGEVGIYWGYVSDYMDWEAILDKCERGAKMLIVGPTKRAHIPEHPNLYYIGTVDHRVLPVLSRCATFGFILWKKTELTETVSAVKMQEYLMAGLPVMLSDWMHFDKGPFTWEDRVEEIVRLIEQYSKRNQ